MYRLRLLSTWKIHDVFHASLLSLFKQTDTHGPSFSVPPLTLIGSEEEYEVETIISHKGSPGRRKYLTAWKGYPSSENTWEPESNLRHAPEILGDYKHSHSLNQLKTTPCLTPNDENERKPQSTLNPPSIGPTSLGSSASPSTNLTSFAVKDSVWTTPKPTHVSVGRLVAPSIPNISGRGVSM